MIFTWHHQKDFVYSQNDYLNNYIQFADTKSAVFITVNGVLMGFLYTQIKDNMPFEFEKSKNLFISEYWTFTCGLCFYFSYFST